MASIIKVVELYLLEVVSH